MPTLNAPENAVWATMAAPGHTFLSPEQTQHSTVAQSTSIYSNKSPSASVDGGFPGLACGGLVAGVDTHGLPTQHLPYSNLQL